MNDEHNIFWPVSMRQGEFSDRPMSNALSRIEPKLSEVGLKVVSSENSVSAPGHQEFLKLRVARFESSAGETSDAFPEEERLRCVVNDALQASVNSEKTFEGRANAAEFIESEARAILIDDEPLDIRPLLVEPAAVKKRPKIPEAATLSAIDFERGRLTLRSGRSFPMPDQLAEVCREICRKNVIETDESIKRLNKDKIDAILSTAKSALEVGLHWLHEPIPAPK